MDNLLKKLFSKPGIILISSDVNCGKSMFVYHLITLLKQQTDSKIYSFGLRKKLVKEIYSVQELETLRDSIIFCDEFANLFDFDDRKNKKMIERTLRLINHNNNIIILSGISNNFNKFISGKANIMIYKKNTIADFINGTSIKNICLSYKGFELGSSILNIPIDKALIWDGEYNFVNVPYYRRFDTKLSNKVIMQQKRPKKCAKSVPKNVQKEENSKQVENIEN